MVKVDNFGCGTAADLASLLGVGIQITTQAATIFASSIEESFQAASIYSSFYGETKIASEGRFWGYKHGSDVGEAVLLTREYMLTGNLFLFTRNPDGSWSCKRII